MKKLKVLSSLLFLSLLTPGIVGCGQASQSSKISVESKIEVESISISASTTTIRVGQTVQLSVNVLPADATDREVEYKTESTAISVSATGLVTGLSLGEGIVKAISHDGNKTDSITIKVVGENQNLTVDELGNKLTETPYTNKGISAGGECGLSSAESVGVVEDQIKELYKMPEDAEFKNNIFEVSSITLDDIKVYFPSASEVNDFYKIQTAINKAIEANKAGNIAKVVLAEGTYDVDASLSSGSKAFSIAKANGLYIEGNNTIINVITNNTAWKGYFDISSSSNVFMNGITMTLAMPSSMSGAITAVDTNAKTITVSINKEFNKLASSLASKQIKLRSWVEFDQNTKAPLQNGNFIVDGFSSYTISGDAESGYSITVKFTSSINRSRNGSLIALGFSQYDASGMNVSSSENIYLEGLTMHYASGMALVANNVTNLYVNRFNLSIANGSSALMTATADAMHFASMHGDVKVTNSLIENSHDDALNIKQGYYYKLTNAEGGSAKKMTITKITGEIDEPKIGDKICVFNESTFEGYNPTQGYYTIASVAKVTNGYDLTVNERMASVGEWGTSRVTIISNTPSFEFTNNIVRNKRNRGVLCQVPNAKIENNTFMNIGHGSIQAATSMDIYNESTLSNGLSLKNNKFINNCYIKPEPLYGDISIFAISNNGTVAPSGTLHDYNIENNFIARNGNSAISMRGVGKSTVKDNLFYECSRTQPSGDVFNCIFNFYNCGDISLEGNYNQYTLDNGLSGIILQGKTSEDMISVASNNYGIEFQKNTDEGPKVDVKKASAPITIDGDLSDWSEDLLDITIDGYSDAEGTKRTAEEVADHFAIKKLKMTYDDTGIYLCFDVFDNELSVKTINDFWLGDCVELFMSTITTMPTADMQVYKDEGGVMQAAFAPGWSSNNYSALSGVRTNSAYMGKKNLLEAMVKTNSDGYTGEVKIPFTFAPEFKTAIDDGKQIDIAIVVADAERDTGLKRVQAANVPHFVEDYKTKTARMPQYFFK